MINASIDSNNIFKEMCVASEYANLYKNMSQTQPNKPNNN